MSQNAITQAIGAKLVPIFLNHPTVISHVTLIGASDEAVQLLELLPPVSAELAEVFRCVDAVIGEWQIAYVTPTKSPEYPYGASSLTTATTSARPPWAKVKKGSPN